MMRGAQIGAAAWYLVLAGIGIFMLPSVTAWICLLRPPDPGSEYFRFGFLGLYIVLPSVVVGLTLGFMGTVPSRQRHWAMASLPAIAVALFYVVAQGVTGMTAWSAKWFLEVFLPTWVPLVGCSLLAGWAMALVRKRHGAGEG